MLDRNGIVCGPTNRHHAVALRDESVRVHTFEKPIPHSIMVHANLPRDVNALSDEDKKSYKKHSHLTRRTDRGSVFCSVRMFCSGRGDGRKS